MSNTVPLFVQCVWHRIQEPGHHTNLHKVSEDWLVLYYVVITENNIDRRMNTIFCLMTAMCAKVFKNYRKPYSNLWTNGPVTHLRL